MTRCAGRATIPTPRSCRGGSPSVCFDRIHGSAVLVERVEWLYSYLTHIAPDLPRALRWIVARRLHVEGDTSRSISALRVHGRDEHAR